MRHSRTHRVALDCLFDRITLEPKFQIKYIDTINQLADMLTKRNSHVMNGIICCVFKINHFSSTICSETIENRLQQESGEARATAKNKNYDESNCKGAVERIILDLSEPGEEKIWITKFPGV